MNNEIEATFRKIDKEKLREKLKEAGATLVKPEFLQSRVVFNLPDKPLTSKSVKVVDNNGIYIHFGEKSLKVSDFEKANDLLQIFSDEDLLKNDNKGWFRIRDEGDRITLTYKRQDSSEIDGMREIELVVDNFDIAFKLLEVLNCKYKAYQETKRELWRFGNVEIMVDEWPFLEPFVEIEGDNELEVKEVAEALGFNWNEAYFGAVDGLYAEKYGITEYQINNETPEILFEMTNPF